MPRPTNVDEYIAAAEPAARSHLVKLRACVREVLADAREELKWGHPAYSSRRILVVFAAHRRHVGFHPTPAVIKAFAKKLKDYKTSSSTIQFPYDEPLPLPLIRKMTKLRAREEAEKDRQWKPVQRS